MSGNQINEYDGLIEYKQAMGVMIGDNLLISKFPCKITQRTTSKTGKHGGCKIHFVGVDIFTEKKYETLHSTSDTVMVPIVTKTDYALMNINDENPPFMSLVGNDDSSILREDIQLLTNDIGNKILNDFNSGKELVLTIMNSMNKEAVISYKINK